MNKTVPTGSVLWIGVLSLLILAPAAVASPADTPGKSDATALARQILEAAAPNGYPGGGLIVHLGCADGKLTAALVGEKAGGRYVVQGLDADADKVRQARQAIQQLGLYGPVSVEQFDGTRLPYAENLVNLIVAEDLGGVTMEEAMRVLAPRGVLCVKQKGRWTRTVKPLPKNTDEWTHFLHDASGNAVAHDEVVGPPRRAQWIAGPRYMRSHEHIPGIYALVSSAGRIFYIEDEGPTGSIRQPSKWNLVARDAYNGILLWKQPIASWFPHIVNWGQTPPQLERRLVAVGDRVYVTLGLHAPLAVLDAASGKILKTYEKTLGTEEIIWHKGVLLAAVRSVTDDKLAELTNWARLEKEDGSPVFSRDTAEPLVKRLKATEAKGDESIVALDADSGRLLWKQEGEGASGLTTNTLSADQDRVFYKSGKDLVCLDLKTGRRLWSRSSAPLRTVCQSGVICADDTGVTALAPETGRTLWTQPATLKQIRDAFVVGGSLWLGGFRVTPPGKRGTAWGPYFATQRDLATGEVRMRVEPDNPGHHHRCYQNKATDRYILGGRRGTEFIDLESGDVQWNSFVRGVCRYGVMPANGLMYAPPHACGCYVGVKLSGFRALAAAPKGEGGKGKVKRELQLQLERGPAYSNSSTLNPHLSTPSRRTQPAGLAGQPSSLIPHLSSSSEWPNYRHDAERSGCAGSAGAPACGSAALRCRWEAEIGGRLTSPTVSDGKVFVASIDQHQVLAIDVDSGQPAWQFTAGARVDSPPTIDRGRAIFGCRDGFVYSLRASDGALAWRLGDARGQRQIVAGGQLESVSPAHGSVLIDGGAAYFTTGESSYLDGGIHLYRIDPAGGKVLSSTAIYSPDPETGKQPPQSAPYLMPGARSDILSADAAHLYLRDAVFDKEGNREQGTGDRGQNAQPSTLSPQLSPLTSHLFTLTGFLDDSWAHRSYWVFGTHCTLSTGCSGQDKGLLFGRLLVCDRSAIYGYGRAKVDWSNQLQDGPYRLFAVGRGDHSTLWETRLSITARAMVLAGKVLFVAGGGSDGIGWLGGDESQEGRLLAVSASDGSVLADYQLDSPPVFDGMAAAGGRLYISLENGRLVSMDEKTDR